MDRLEEIVNVIEGHNLQAGWGREGEESCSLGIAVQTLFELFSQPALASSVLDRITASVQLQDALVRCILQASQHLGKMLEYGYCACRLLNQTMFDRLVQEPAFAVALGRRNQKLISPKKTAALTVLMEQAQGCISDEAASLMYTLERTIAEDDFRISHEKAMQNR
mmetsp:Transcript_64324/g.134212  ORF Transcript_64324/g.134212 Transcript_64324/m.134212 type:complete len:166 (-) Transcript_64324:173-670(-)|eukprot:CAMPEP_0181289136 /NCGR_PEP_ID=MMETSP1101-20121128/721_1 /TAXON_ID=46948 /ORGANISM="Rhodomonas abbreviata, Strain Caron Lab Isolate" /LENGTH=165 /DNA_ID=CAMNT_0023393337 /DNA_START=59 /DNA_END=556 /DNA_ORIENTATION=-